MGSSCHSLMYINIPITQYSRKCWPLVYPTSQNFAAKFVSTPTFSVNTVLEKLYFRGSRIPLNNKYGTWFLKNCIYNYNMYICF